MSFDKHLQRDSHTAIKMNVLIIPVIHSCPLQPSHPLSLSTTSLFSEARVLPFLELCVDRWNPTICTVLLLTLSLSIMLLRFIHVVRISRSFSAL